jgi:hypothetical protein
MDGEVSLMAANDHTLWNLGAGLKDIISEMEQRQRRVHTNINAPSKLGLFNAFQQMQCLGEMLLACRC